jgi:hypothetical protein
VPAATDYMSRESDLATIKNYPHPLFDKGIVSNIATARDSSRCTESLLGTPEDPALLRPNADGGMNRR